MRSIKTHDETYLYMLIQIGGIIFFSIFSHSWIFQWEGFGRGGVKPLPTHSYTAAFACFSSPLVKNVITSNANISRTQHSKISLVLNSESFS